MRSLRKTDLFEIEEIIQNIINLKYLSQFRNDHSFIFLYIQITNVDLAEIFFDVMICRLVLYKKIFYLKILCIAVVMKLH